MHFGCSVFTPIKLSDEYPPFRSVLARTFVNVTTLKAALSVTVAQHFVANPVIWCRAVENYNWKKKVSHQPNEHQGTPE